MPSRSSTGRSPHRFVVAAGLELAYDEVPGYEACEEELGWKVCDEDLGCDDEAREDEPAYEVCDACEP
jgi:hypothetical protein